MARQGAVASRLGHSCVLFVASIGGLRTFPQELIELAVAKFTSRKARCVALLFNRVSLACARVTCSLEEVSDPEWQFGPLSLEETMRMGRGYLDL